MAFSFALLITGISNETASLSLVMLVEKRELKERFSNMADKSSSGPIPEGWRFEIIKKKNGSKVSSYCCPGTGQRFSTYEDMMRYVIYAKKAGLPIYMPNFHWSKRNQNAGQSSESAGDQRNPLLVAIEENLDSEKGTNTEKSLDLEKGTNTEKSLDSKEGTDTEMLDLEKTSDAGENLKPQNKPSVNLSAPAADIVTCDELVLLQRLPNVPPVAPAAGSLIHDDLFFLQQIPNVPHVASGAGTRRLENPFIVEQTPNVPPVVGSTPGEEDSPLVAVPPAMIQEFAARNPRSRFGPGASKPRRFRRWGH